MGYIIPSKVFNSFEEFINTLKIPYYDGYTIQVVDGDEKTCFDKSDYLKIYPIGIIIIFSIILIFL